jgi:hypothetical protein
MNRWPVVWTRYFHSSKELLPYRHSGAPVQARRFLPGGTKKEFVFSFSGLPVKIDDLSLLN